MAATLKKYSSAEYLYQAYSSDTVDPAHLESKVSDKSKNETCLTKIHTKMMSFGSHLSKLRLEMVAFIFTFSYVMTKVSSTTMILDKVCLVHFGYPSFVCNNLENFTAIKTSIEKLATNYQLGHSLLQVAPAAVLACFIGPWSDHYGRKFPIMLALCGMILDAIGSIICAYYLETRVEYYYIPAVFTGIFGGPVAILAVVYSYVSDSTELSQRTMKYALIEMAAGFAMPFGATAGGWIYKFLGYPAVYFFSFSGLCLSLLWVAFLLKETRGLDNDDPWLVKLGEMFTCKTFKESFIAVAKPRPHKGRIQVVLLIISMCFLVITMNSTGDINYLYVHHQFGWSNTKYSTITSIYSIFAILILVVLIPLIRFYKVGDTYLGLFGTVSFLIKNIGIGIAWKEGVYHVASIFGLMGGCSTFAARARISKVVSKEDLGKVFSFVAASESLLPVLATVLMSQLFSAFIEVFPGIPYITLALFLILPFGAFCWMSCLPKLSYEDLSHPVSRTEDIYTSI